MSIEVMHYKDVYKLRWKGAFKVGNRTIGHLSR